MKFAKGHSPNRRARGFTLLEVICALGILSIICSSAMVIMARNIQSSYNVTMRLRALEVARENMEQILVLDRIEEQTEYGTSEIYPAIEWESSVETFYAPLEGQTWARARCLARYKDMEDKDQDVELEHWLCRVKAADMNSLEDINGAESALFRTLEEAVEYLGVDEQDVLSWLENGMVQTPEGYFIQANLQLYKRTQGNPSAEERDQQAVTGVFLDVADPDIEAGLEAVPEPDPGTFNRRGGR
ncbi:MAG: type II secretion system GspH family protein [Phycisphaerae bacterium]|nr:type II secretion system GspH family protein [Phycisphaerae bacterium]